MYKLKKCWGQYSFSQILLTFAQIMFFWHLTDMRRNFVPNLGKDQKKKDLHFQFLHFRHKIKVKTKKSLGNPSVKRRKIDFSF